MFTMELAFCLIWTGALSTYLASPSQQLLKKPISKILGWGLLAIFITVSSYLLNMEFAAVTSVLFSLGVLFMSWQFIIFIAGHWKVKLSYLSCGGFITLLSLAQLGGA